jgi:hypothetical protein
MKPLTAEEILVLPIGAVIKIPLFEGNKRPPFFFVVVQKVIEGEFFGGCFLLVGRDFNEVRAFGEHWHQLFCPWHSAQSLASQLAYRIA